MGHKRGFTMIELLAVLVILGIIMIIAVPSVVSYMQSARTDYYEKLEDSITTTGQEYFSDHRSLMPKENGQIYSVNITDLISEGYTSEIVDSDGNDTCTGMVYVKRLATADFEYHTCISCGKTDSAGNKEYQSTSSFCTTGSTGGTGDGTCDKPKDNPLDDCFMITMPDPFKVPQCMTVEDSATSQGISLDGVVLNNGEDIGDRITADTTSVDYKNLGNYKIYYTYKQVLNPAGEKYNTNITIYDDKAPSEVDITMHTDSESGANYICTTRENCQWTGKNVYITFTATDLSDCATEGSGVKEFAYRYGNSGGWQYVAATKTTQNGKNVYKATIVRDSTYDGPIQVKAIDNASSSGASKNLESAATEAYLLVDKTPPTCVSSGGNSAWINASSNPGTLTLTGTCSDANSGCAGNVSKTYSTDINSTTETPGTVYDKVGNSTECPKNQTVRIDKTKPNVSVSASSQRSGFNTNTANVSVGQSDNLSGVTQMCILRDNSNVNSCNWQNYTSAAQSLSTGHGYDGGSVRFYAWTKDAAGNISNATSTVYTIYRQCSSTRTEWGGWSSCSTRCGNGTQSRSGTKYDSFLGSNCGGTSQSQGCSDSSGCPPPEPSNPGKCEVDYNTGQGFNGAVVTCIQRPPGSNTAGCSGQCGWGDEQIVCFTCP